MPSPSPTVLFQDNRLTRLREKRAAWARLARNRRQDQRALQFQRFHNPENLPLQRPPKTANDPPEYSTSFQLFHLQSIPGFIKVPRIPTLVNIESSNKERVGKVRGSLFERQRCVIGVSTLSLKSLLLKSRSGFSAPSQAPDTTLSIV